jgi:hypothetical protein
VTVGASATVPPETVEPSVEKRREAARDGVAGFPVAIAALVRGHDCVRMTGLLGNTSDASHWQEQHDEH